MKSKDRIGGIIFAIIGLAVVIIAQGIKQGVNLTEPGPRLFPRIAGVGIIVCGLLMAIEAKPSEEKPFLDKAGWKRLAVAVGAMFIYYFALTYLGFLISTPIFTFAIINILASGKKLNQILVVAISLVSTIALYFVFQKLFVMILPAGSLLKAMGINLTF